MQKNETNRPNAEHGNMSEEERRLKERRRVLQLGVAGMPMMLSLRASAQSVANSALDCTITIPRGLVILVNSDGAAWVTDRVNIRNNRVTNGRVRRIQRRADYVFPEGTVPAQYRPRECDDNGNGPNVTLDCQYVIYRFDNNTTFEPGQFVDSTGQFNVSGDTGLYLVLAARFADQGGANSGFPGVSCLVSILDFVNQP
ncbi:hypothetical protein [Kordiimonas sp. SCSIO 12610]|uniref:hypothetical protein n=1 Tax=Kordiimonas sp. SCSIO 12610 TaxID=2829597 RepID=UPI00210D1B4A|nr:hypothetical protein [Kordiimonas sp. SCSIO 12610]UTW54143.1 hypothetical protein KFF44_09910 [Kordiimonas sp. SCSIO 12610]